MGFKEQHHEMTGVSTILEKLEEVGLNCEYLHRQGYGGSKSMAGIRRGTAVAIYSTYLLPVHVLKYLSTT